MVVLNNSAEITKPEAKVTHNHSIGDSLKDKPKIRTKVRARV